MPGPRKPDSPFRCFNSSPEVIRPLVLVYVRFPLSLRDVEDLLFERGIDICHETVGMADDVSRWCETRQAFGRTVSVKVKYGDFQQITRSWSQPAAVTTQEALHRSALGLIRSVLPPEKGIRLVGVTVSNVAEPQAIMPGELPISAGVAA